MKRARKRALEWPSKEMEPDDKLMMIGCQLPMTGSSIMHLSDQYLASSPKITLKPNEKIL